MAFADKADTFPAEATMEQKGLDYDYDFDGRTNGEEFVEGTSLTDQNDYLRSWIEHEEGVGTTVHFHPYFSDRIYALKEGLSTDTEDPEIISSVPVLGDLPLVGSFFRSAEAPDTNTELIVFVSVTLVESEGG